MKTTLSADIANKALDFRSLRQKLIASNLANVSTPYYKARDVDFESFLAKEADKLYKEDSRVKMAKTHPTHLDPTSIESSQKAEIFFRSTHATRNDGNSVDLDIESTEMSKNSMLYNAIINAKRKTSMIFKSVIEASSKVQ